MAGGAGWKLITKEDKADFYQKVENGPWYMRKRVSFIIRKPVLGSTVDIGPGEQGEKSGSITVDIGNVTKSRSFTPSLVCKSDVYSDMGEGHNYYTRTQEWSWVDDDEEEVFNAE